jgi:hypothetical protein
MFINFGVEIAGNDDRIPLVQAIRLAIILSFLAWLFYNRARKETKVVLKFFYAAAALICLIISTSVWVALFKIIFY